MASGLFLAKISEVENPVVKPNVVIPIFFPEIVSPPFSPI
jgi:hypothetical protein